MMQTRQVSRVAACLGLLITLTACSGAGDPGGIHDPYEAANRRVHAFNKGLDGAFSGSEDGPDIDVPPAIAEGVANFADNVALPGMVVNNLLQGDLEGGLHNTVRFAINTVFGAGGLADTAGAIGITRVETDFGETLHVWGVPEGAYLELPVLGPTTERDLAGRIVDHLINPLEFVGTPEQVKLALPATLADKVLTRMRFSDSVGDVLHGSADSYAQARLIYLQHRRFELNNSAGAVDPYAIDPYAIDPYQEIGQ